MGCAISTEEAQTAAEAAVRAPVEEVPIPGSPYQDPIVEGCLRRKGILSSTTSLEDYQRLMMNLGAIDAAVDGEMIDDDNDLFTELPCDCFTVRISDANSNSDRAAQSLTESYSIFETQLEFSGSPSTSFLAAEVDSVHRHRRNTCMSSSVRTDVSLPGSIGRARSVSFSPDTPFVEGKALPLSKRMRALQQLKSVSALQTKESSQN